MQDGKKGIFQQPAEGQLLLPERLLFEQRPSGSNEHRGSPQPGLPRRCIIRKEISMELKNGTSFVVRAEKEGDVCCPICHKLLHVEAGQVIPRCCGKVMQMLD